MPTVDEIMAPAGQEFDEAWLNWPRRLDVRNEPFAGLQRVEGWSIWFIAQKGYSVDLNTLAKFPLYPILTQVLANWLGLPITVVFFIINKVALYLTLRFGYHLGEQAFGENRGIFAALLLVAPYGLRSIVWVYHYDEPLLTMATILAVYWAMSGRWGLTAGMLCWIVLLKPTGIVLAFAIACGVLLFYVHRDMTEKNKFQLGRLALLVVPALVWICWLLISSSIATGNSLTDMSFAYDIQVAWRPWITKGPQRPIIWPIWAAMQRLTDGLNGDILYLEHRGYYNHLLRFSTELLGSRYEFDSVPLRWEWLLGWLSKEVPNYLVIFWGTLTVFIFGFRNSPQLQKQVVLICALTILGVWIPEWDHVLLGICLLIAGYLLLIGWRLLALICVAIGLAFWYQNPGDMWVAWPIFVILMIVLVIHSLMHYRSRADAVMQSFVWYSLAVVTVSLWLGGTWSVERYSIPTMYSFAPIMICARWLDGQRMRKLMYRLIGAWWIIGIVLGVITCLRWWYITKQFWSL